MLLRHSCYFGSGYVPPGQGRRQPDPLLVAADQLYPLHCRRLIAMRGPLSGPSLELIMDVGEAGLTVSVAVG